MCVFLTWQNYFEKLEKLSAAEEVQGDGPKKERTKLITPQVARLEHTYKPGKVLLPGPGIREIWQGTDRLKMNNHIDGWVEMFETHKAPCP